MPKEYGLKAKIYKEVFEGIIKGEYGPDDVLSEKSLVEKFGVSKSPVREALIELCNEGVLRSIPRYGYEVIRLTDRNVEDIKQFRIVLECGSLDRNWDLITPEMIRLLQGVASYTSLGGEFNALTHWEKNSDFHLKLISFYNNQYIYQSLKSSLQVLNRAYAQFYWDRWHKTMFVSSSDRHRQTIQCMIEGDREGAIRSLQNDISGFDEISD